MLNLSVFSHNHHPSGVNLLAKYIRRGIQGILIFNQAGVYMVELGRPANITRQAKSVGIHHLNL